MVIAISSQVGYRPDWPTSAWKALPPEAVGLSSSDLATADSYASSNGSYGLMVVRHGRVAFEKYYSGNSAATGFSSYSVAKSLTSIAVGRAIREGLLASVDVTAQSILGPSTNNPYWSQITIEHLLQMQSGMAYNYNDMIATDNWVDYLIEEDGVAAPGVNWRYKNDPIVISGIISEVTGQSLKSYFQSEIGTPLGLSSFTWTGDMAGHTDGNGGATLTVREMAKIGYLMLNDGVWDGTRLLPRGWVSQSTAPCRSAERQEADVWDTEDTVITDPPMEYGYFWMCRKLADVPGDAYWAFGGVGQFIVVIPSLDMVVVRTGNGPSESDKTFLPTLLADIVAAVQ
jgi:CubicO group peptidase (beta-lactamase class C family)